MNVLIDTPIWSEAFRRAHGHANETLVMELQELINEQRIILIGPVRQEILSGIKELTHFNRLRNNLRVFPNLPIEATDYETAAEMFNHCRTKGIQGSSTDFLICAIAHRHGFAIFTTDHDFRLFSRHLKLKLHETRK